MTAAKPREANSLTSTLLPFAGIVFLGYSAIGIPLSTLPVQVHDTLGYGTTMVGAIVGLAAAATLLTRQLAGALADRRGPKLAVLIGLGITALAGLAYLVSLAVPPRGAIVAIGFGRLVLGLGDSVFTTGVMAWAVTRVGPHNAGRAMAWIGIAMYGALAIGAPVGVALDALGGFGAVALLTAAMPLLAIPIALRLTGLPASAASHRASFLQVVRAIWAQGLAMVLGSAGFGTIAAFLALRYAAQGWTGTGWSSAGVALSAFGGAYIVTRLLFAGLPDRLGGMRVAMAALAIEAVGLALIALAAHPLVALAGTAVTGLGYSLVFPSLGVEAVRRVPPESRGVALGAFLGCFDLGLGASGPLTGLVASGFGLSAAFTAAAAASVVSMALVGVAGRR
jgi:predicted MFS family arabinose efflux permease